MLRHLGRALPGALAAIVAVALLNPPALAQETLHATHGDWVVLRSPEGGCQMRSTILSRESGAILLEMILRPQPDGAPGALVGLRAPVGVSLADGIAYRHPETPEVAIGLEWQSCDAALCLAVGAISDGALDALRRGARVEVGFRPLPGARAIRLPVSLRGVTAGWRAVAACEAG